MSFTETVSPNPTEMVENGNSILLLLKIKMEKTITELGVSQKMVMVA
jgi:hypothetical protein